MGNEEMGRKHVAFYSAGVLLLQSSNVMRKSMSISEKIIYTLQFAPKGYAMALHHGRQASTSLLAACLP